MLPQDSDIGPSFQMHWLSHATLRSLSALAVVTVVLLLWRLWRFMILPILRPREPRELPYWIPCKSFPDIEDDDSLTYGRGRSLR